MLYKERNLLLTSRQKTKRRLQPNRDVDENRYINVKRSMAAIKFVLDERKKIDKMLLERGELIEPSSPFTAALIKKKQIEANATPQTPQKSSE